MVKILYRIRVINSHYVVAKTMASQIQFTSYVSSLQVNFLLRQFVKTLDCYIIQYCFGSSLLVINIFCVAVMLAFFV